MAFNTRLTALPFSREKSRVAIASGYPSIFSTLLTFLAPPTRTEIQACWELCRLQNGMGCTTVFLPVAWSLAMVYHAYPELSGIDVLHRSALYFFLCIGIKSLIMTVDDILDYDIDAHVERTKDRAIPRGAISIERAWLFFALQAVVGVYLANIFLSPDALHISMAVWPLYVLYPTCKRWMYFAPIPLGLMFNIGIFMGWADLTPDGRIPWASLTAAYVGGILWTITYETVYQHQDKLDDAKIGMKSLAIFCGEYTIPTCATTTIGFASLMSYSGHLNGQSLPYYLAVAISGGIMFKELLSTDIDDPRQCMKFFLRTPMIGNIVLGGLVLDAILQRAVDGIPL
ncbi:UbiA prenyltransferase family-domain-containing protein [Desarmillaria ectypa]|nr:UbiA prenyltransferase family-domain-containing protein [Desarmillaria ectypa]